MDSLIELTIFKLAAEDADRGGTPVGDRTVRWHLAGGASAAQRSLGHSGLSQLSWARFQQRLGQNHHPLVGFLGGDGVATIVGVGVAEGMEDFDGAVYGGQTAVEQMAHFHGFSQQG